MSTQEIEQAKKDFAKYLRLLTKGDTFGAREIASTFYYATYVTEQEGKN